MIIKEKSNASALCWVSRNESIGFVLQKRRYHMIYSTLSHNKQKATTIIFRPILLSLITGPLHTFIHSFTKLLHTFLHSFTKPLHTFHHSFTNTLYTLNLLAAFMLVLAGNTFAQTSTDTLVVTTQPQMHCQNCEKKIKTNIRFVKDTKDINNSIDDQKVTIVYDCKKAKYEDFVAAFKKIGYEIKKK